MDRTDNHTIAERLRETAWLLEQQGANPYRVNAYRRAADAIQSLHKDLAVVFQEDGFQGLVRLAGIGPQIAGAIVEMLRTGRWMQLERLRGTLDPEAVFSSVPGIGPRLARLVMNSLNIDTLEGLEIAADDGRLATVPRFGPRRIAMIRAELAQMLGRARAQAAEPVVEPSVDLLLDVDREYRDKAQAGLLRRIAPRRFNPGSKAWLPILHTERTTWHFTAIFSNTGLAHRLGRTNDWVVIHFNQDGHEGQCTVVTETHGQLEGKRVVRGRERECEVHYRLPVQLPLNVA
jgi:putative hydrolase